MRILYPPRPHGKMPFGSLRKYEQEKQWVAQRKFNGTHVLINISPEKDVSILTRHGQKPKLFSLSAYHIQQFLSLNLKDGHEYWLQGELLDHKTTDKNYKQRIVLFDILQAGRYLINGPTLLERYSLLSQICRNPSEKEPANQIALKVSENIWLAETFLDDFEKHFKEFLHLDEIEGLVLKKKRSRIDNMGTKEYDVHWMIRCRKPNKNYNF